MPRHVRQLTRTRKWKHKEGRGTSHSYWSRTHGPRGTTHGTSGRRPWLWRVSRRGCLHPAGCPSSFSRQPRSYSGGGGTESVSRKRVLPPRVSGRGKYRRKGGREDPQGSQEAP